MFLSETKSHLNGPNLTKT